ncbi:MAG: thermonuclease family protein [Rhodospirillaceae bacterium]|nr:thermonuclease family protein [Rhodospirillaceae bacterium]
MARFAVVFLFILTVTTAAAASEPAVPLPAAVALDTEARVVEVVDGSTVLLDDGERVRLAGIEAPKHIAGDAASGMELLAETARRTLARLVQGRRVGLATGGVPRDRYGRLRAHLVRSDDGTWIQGALLAAGLARVHSLVDDRAAVAEMLVIEQRARAAGLGIWSQPRYRVRTADQANDGLNSFQLVEGRVKAAAVVRGRGYLNFGDDWREDFTVSIGPRDRRRFESDGIAIEDYEGRLVRVRGWVDSFNGPMIEATHPEQIEVLE